MLYEVITRQREESFGTNSARRDAMSAMTGMMIGRTTAKSVGMTARMTGATAEMRNNFV